MEVGGPEVHPAVKSLRCRGRALPCGNLKTHVHPRDCCPHAQMLSHLFLPWIGPEGVSYLHLTTQDTER